MAAPTKRRKLRTWSRVVDRASYDAVLWEISRCYGLWGLRNRNRDMWQSQLMEQLLRSRSQRVVALFKQGWLAGPERERTRRRVLHCPPFAVSDNFSVGDRLFACGQYWCPFCWARSRVYTAYQKWERFLFSREGLAVRNNRTTKQIYVELRLRYDGRRMGSPRALDRLLQDTVRLRKSLKVALQQTHGAISLSVLEPSRHSLSWFSVTRVLLSMSGANRQIEWNPPKGLEEVSLTRRKMSCNTRLELGKAVAYTCRYPAGMFAARLREVLRLVTYEHHQRLLSFHGGLYGWQPD